MSTPGPIKRHARACPDPQGSFSFVRPGEIDQESMLTHLRDPSIARHLPLLTDKPDRSLVQSIIASKEESWIHDGLGHWGILHEGRYAGWGGFQREADEWDFGLVLRRDYFRQGRIIASMAFEWARRDTDIEAVTFLLPMTRSRRALQRLGAVPIGVCDISGIPFRKWSLALDAIPRPAPGEQGRRANFDDVA